jgi:hypothetical protein
VLFIVIVIGMMLYVVSCILIVRLHLKLRLKARGKLFFEYMLWFAFIVIYLPFSFFFPAWLTEYFAVWERTSTTTMTMLFLGVLVSASCLFKYGRVREI